MKKQTVNAAVEFAAVLSASAAAMVTAHIKSDVVSDGKKVKAVDAIQSCGITSTLLESVKNGGCKETRESVSNAIVLGFPANAQKLLATGTKGMSEKNKEVKKYWQQQIGSKIATYRHQLKLREGVETTRGAQTPDGETDKDAETNSDGSVKSAKTVIIEALLKAKTRAQKEDAPDFDVTKLVKAIDVALSIAGHVETE